MWLYIWCHYYSSQYFKFAAIYGTAVAFKSHCQALKHAFILYSRLLAQFLDILLVQDLKLQVIFSQVKVKF